MSTNIDTGSGTSTGPWNVSRMNPAGSSHPSPAEFEAERVLLWDLLTRDYGGVFSYEQRRHDFELLWWFRWDHPRCIGYYGSRAEGNCWEARLIIPGAFEAIPGANPPPIVPTQASLNKQKIQNAEILRLERNMLETQRMEEAERAEMGDIPSSCLIVWRLDPTVRHKSVGRPIGVVEETAVENNGYAGEDVSTDEDLDEVPRSYIKVWDMNHSVEEDGNSSNNTESGTERSGKTSELSANVANHDDPQPSQTAANGLPTPTTTANSHFSSPASEYPTQPLLHDVPHHSAPATSSALIPAPNTLVLERTIEEHVRVEGNLRLDRMSHAIDHIRAHLDNTTAREQVDISLDGLKAEFEWFKNEVLRF